MGAFLSYNINASGRFIIAAGALLGVCAGLLWTAQGSLVLAYATEDKKGKLSRFELSVQGMLSALTRSKLT